MAINPQDPSVLQDNQTPPNSNSTKNDNFQFILALIIVVPFVLYIGLFYLSNMAQQAKDILSMMGHLLELL